MVAMASAVSACSHRGGGVVPSTSSATAPVSGMIALERARQINPTQCTFSAPVNHFADGDLRAGNVLWFNSSMSASGGGFNLVNVYITHSTVTFSAPAPPPQKGAGDVDPPVKPTPLTYTVNLPDSVVTISPSSLSASLSYNDAARAWQEVIPTGIPGNFFADGGTFNLVDRLQGAKDATWSAVISTDTPGLKLTWQWAAQSYTTLGADYNGMGVKPMDSSTATVYQNTDDAGTPENFKSSLAHGAGNGMQKGPPDRWTGHFTQPFALTPCQLGAAGAGPTPTPVPTPIPPGSTPAPTASPSPGATPAATPTPVAQPTHPAYITNFADNTVSVVDTNTHRVTQTIAVGSAPYGVAVDNTVGSVYVGNRFDGTISVINTTTGQVTATIPLAPEAGGAFLTPFVIAVNPSGTRAYVASNDNNAGGSTAVIDTSSNTEIAQLAAPAGSLPFAPIVSPDGSRVYVSNLGSQSVTVYDATSNAFLASIALSGGDGNGIAISPDGSTLYVCNGGQLSYVNTLTQLETGVTTFAGGCSDVILNSLGTTAYVSNNTGNTVTVLNAATHAVLATVSVGQLPEGMAVSRSGNEVYVANANSNSVSVISTTTNSVTNTIAVGAQPFAFGAFIK